MRFQYSRLQVWEGTSLIFTVREKGEKALMNGKEHSLLSDCKQCNGSWRKMKN
jgi:hypothetical protein